MGWSFEAATISRIRPLKASGRATSVLRAPWKTTPLTFFDPMTAPAPPLPRLRHLLFSMQAKRSRFSPAGPMTQACAFGSPTRSLMRSSAS